MRIMGKQQGHSFCTNRTNMNYHSRHTSWAKYIMRVEHTNQQREIHHIYSSHSWPNVMVYTCNLTTSEVEARGSEFEVSVTKWVQSQPELWCETVYLKKKSSHKPLKITYIYPIKFLQWKLITHYTFIERESSFTKGKVKRPATM